MTVCSNSDLRPIYICGSTASGKSALAIEIAKSIKGEIVNGDAYQLYKGIETIAASPTQEEQGEVPHHLYSVLDVSTELDAQKYRELALPVIKSIQKRGRIPIVVGGSGMYLKFITHGPSAVPASDKELRAKLEQLTDLELASKLQELDPKGAEMTNLQNRRYVIRALEISILSGAPMSEVKNDWKLKGQEIERTLRGGVLYWEVEKLRERIALRTKKLLQKSTFEEIKRYSANLYTTSSKAIGVSQIIDYLDGHTSIEECEEKIFHVTCRYAKRQRTWLRKEKWLSPLHLNDSNSGAKNMASKLLESLQ